MRPTPVRKQAQTVGWAIVMYCTVFMISKFNEWLDELEHLGSLPESRLGYCNLSYNIHLTLRITTSAGDISFV